MRGNLREALERFAEVLGGEGQAAQAQTLRNNIRDWFGPKTDENRSDAKLEQNRARLQFDYYWRCPCPGGENAPRHRITLNPQTGTVKRGALVVIESPAASGERLEFSGGIFARFDSEKQAREAWRWLEKAALFLPALGSLKGVGFGKLLDAKLAPAVLKEEPAAALDGKTRRIGLTLRLDRPFCVAKPRSADANTFSSEESLPGGVLKGALAQSLDTAQKAALHFDALVFTHAVPALPETPGRARVLPLSLAWAGKPLLRENLVDLALLEEGCVRKTAAGFLAPKLPIDWKPEEENAARKLAGAGPGCPRHLAVHTVIDPETGQSEEERLFSLDCVDPQGLEWRADIELGGVDEGLRPGLVEALRKTLAHPLRGIGKTKAVASLRLGAALAGRGDA